MEMIATKIPVVKKMVSAADVYKQRNSVYNGQHLGDKPDSRSVPQKSHANVTSVRPWTSISRGQLPAGPNKLRPRTAGPGRPARSNLSTTTRATTTRLASSSTSSLRSGDGPQDAPSRDLSHSGSRMSNSTEPARENSRAGTYRRAEYFDLSSPADTSSGERRKAGHSPDKGPHRQRQTPMLSPISGRTSSSTRPVSVQPWSVTEVPEEEDTNEPPKSRFLSPQRMSVPPARPKTAKRMRENSVSDLKKNSSRAEPLVQQRSFPPPTKERTSTVPDNSPQMQKADSSGSLFHILTNKDQEDCLLTEAHVVPNGDARESESSSSSSDEELPVPEVPDRRRGRRISNRRQSLQNWVDGPNVDSDDYDTDLEEDFPPEPETNVDATGAFVYEEKCEKEGVVPVTYLLRNMGEGNLRMRHHYLGGQGTKPLAQALKKNTVCEEIDLSDNYIEGMGAAALADTLKDNMFIVNLNVSNNFIRSEGAEKMAEMLESNTTLKTLSLQGNQLSDQDAKRIAESLKNNMSLNCLDLSHNKFGEVGGIYLAQGISANIGLADLDLSWNCLREKGGVAIAKALTKNTALEILDLSWNGLAYPGAVALANALKSNKTLKVLDISNNRLSPEGAKILGKALAKNMGLETLLMGLNPIGAEGVEAVLKGVAAHPRLKLLGIENTMDLSMIPALANFVSELMESRDIMIMATTGPPQQTRINTTVLAVFDRFLTENADRMEDLFNQMDKDGSGDVTLEELKYGLKDFGLRLTSKQLDTLLDELDADKSGTIEYSELMQGSALIKREKQKMDRAAAEAMMYKDNTTANSSSSPTNGSNGATAGKPKTEVVVK